MKVVVHSGSIPSTTFIERLIENLAAQGFEILVHGRKAKNFHGYTGNIRMIGYGGRLSQFILGARSILGLLFFRPANFRKLLKLYHAKKLSRAFLEWFAATGPIVRFEPDIFHLQWAKSVSEWMFLQSFGIKMVFSIRGSHINYSPIGDERLAASYREWFPKVDGFHGVSEAICREAAKYGADPDKCRVVYSGLDLNEFPFAEVKRVRRDEIEIISVGRPHWIKGYHFALDAMKLLADRGVRFKYRIVGGINEELLFQIHDLRLTENVIVEERLDFKDVKSRISSADILLLSSVEEGIPNVVLEAMALGTPVISTDCGGVSEVIQDNVNGFLVPIRDPEAIADNVQQVLSLSDCCLDKVRHAARKKIEEQHTQEKMVADMKSLYEFVLSQPS